MGRLVTPPRWGPHLPGVPHLHVNRPLVFKSNSPIQLNPLARSVRCQLVPNPKSFSTHITPSPPRLCSNGARSPQATNIWSRATEKEKRSPAQAPRFRLVSKPETKPATSFLSLCYFYFFARCFLHCALTN